MGDAKWTDYGLRTFSDSKADASPDAEGICNVAIIAAVKRLLCLFLTLWFVLQTGVAQAHVALEDVHRVAHASGTTGHVGVTDSTNEELCGVAQCCHTAALPSAHREPFVAARVARGRMLCEPLSMRKAPSDIERPKWTAATLAVADIARQRGSLPGL